MQDWKKQDQMSGFEKQGLETAGPFDQGWKMRDQEKEDQCIIVGKVEIGKHAMENAGLENGKCPVICIVVLCVVALCIVAL